MTQQTDFRVLCAEPTDELSGDASANPHHDSDALVARARAALAAEPEAEMVGPSDEELLRMAAEALGYERISPGRIYGAAEAYGDELLAFARAVLARYGHQPAPPADVTPGPSIEAVGSLIAWLSEQACQAADAGQPTDAGMLTWAAQVIGEQVDEDAPAPMAEGEAIGPEWQPCVKLPITVHVREQRPGETHVSTREGITPVRPDDLIMRGVQGEEYPIGRELFNKTYRLGAAGHQPAPPVEGGVGELVEFLRVWATLCPPTDKPSKFTRAADLLERQVAPVPVAPYREVADLVVWLEDHSAECLELDRPEWSKFIAKAAKFLHLYLKAAPVPVPVSERLPGAGDCDGEGRCWWFCFECPGEHSYWILAKEVYCDPTYWLPSTALPLPQGEGEK